MKDLASALQKVFSALSTEDILIIVAAAAALALFIAIIVVSSAKKKMNTIRPSDNANGYLVDGSFDLTRDNEFFIYETVTKVPKPKQQERPQGPGHGGMKI